MKSIISFFRNKNGIDLPSAGNYATGILFLDPITHKQAEQHFESIAIENGLRVLCWRDVPTNSKCIGEVARSNEPVMRQVFVVPNEKVDESEFKRKVSQLYLIYMLVP
jgi:glutamate synthase domain-containing protein 1